MSDFITNTLQDFFRKNRILSKKNIRNYFDQPKGLIAVMEGNGTNSWDCESLTANMREVVSQLTRGKDTAILWFKKFWAYLEQKKLICGSSEFPPIQISNTFERRIYIAKYLQDPKHKISELEQILWVNGRTIEQDLKVLRGNDLEEAIQICGKTFTIPESERRNNGLAMGSTVHPLFLTCNLTQVITMLRGLKLLKDDPALGAYSITQAVDIWQQLSTYAKNRILYVTEKLLSDDLEWYQFLEGEKCGNTFRSEKMCSHYGNNCVFDCWKNGRACSIEYRPNPVSSSVFLKNCAVKSYAPQKHSVVIRTEAGEDIEIDLDTILSSAYASELLI